MLVEAPFALVDLVVNMVAYGTEQVVFGPLARRLQGLSRVAMVALAVLALVRVAAWRARPSARRAMLACALMTLGTYGSSPWGGRRSTTNSAS